MITHKRVGWRTAVLVGMSTDEKPTNVENGTQFNEIDTGYSYFFDGANLTWHKAEKGGGGSGGSGIPAEEKGAANGVAPLNADAEIDRAYLPSPIINRVTLVTGSWTLDSSSGYYAQSVTVQGMTADNQPRATVVYPSGTTVSSKAYIDEAANLLVYMETGANTVTFYAVDAPSVALTMQLFEA